MDAFEKNGYEDTSIYRVTIDLPKKQQKTRKKKKEKFKCLNTDAQKKGG